MPIGQPKNKGGPLLFAALDRDLAALQVQQLLTDGQSEPCTAIPPRDVETGLGKMFEDKRKTGFRNADTRIRYREQQVDLAGRAFLRGDLQLDPPLFGEFEGIADQVDQHLVQPIGIPIQDIRDTLVHLYAQLQAFFGDPVGE